MRGVYSQAKGIGAEYTAAEYLKEQGYRVIATNYTVKGVGEIDVIVEKEELLIFVEVKYRQDESFGTGLESVTRGKMRRLVNTARRYLFEQGESDRKIRFDLVVVSDLEIEHYPNAIYGTWF